ncbi:hypothetical protein GCM10009611_16100 [Arthrobacter roseus]
MIAASTTLAAGATLQFFTDTILPYRTDCWAIHPKNKGTLGLVPEGSCWWRTYGSNVSKAPHWCIPLV